MNSTVSKVICQFTKIKVSSVLKNNLEKSKIKLVVHTYSGEYFPLYKNGDKKIFRNVNEYQAYG